MRTPLPNKGLRCPHCKVALKHVPTPWGLLGVLVLLYLPVVVVVLLMTMKLLGMTIMGVMVYFVVIYLLWHPFELIAAYRLRSRAELTLK